MSQQHCQQSEPPKPSAWCERMERNAKDGDEAYAYFQLKQMWQKREGSDKCQSVNMTLGCKHKPHYGAFL